MLNKIFIIFLLMVSLVMAGTEEVSNDLQIGIVGDNLTITNSNTHWFFNTSSTVSSTITDRFNVSLNDYGNCSAIYKAINDTFNKCDDRWKANTLLAVNLESCDSGKNPKCAEQKSIAQNKTSELTTCTNNLKTKTTEYDTKNNALTTCETEKKQMYPSWWTWVGGFGVLAGCWYFWRYNKHATTSVSQNTEEGQQPADGGISPNDVKEALDNE